MSAISLSCLLALISNLPAALPEDFGDAQWLRDPVFDAMPIKDLYHREKQKQEDPKGITNVHTLFRKDIVVRAGIRSAYLSITGDDYYKFYINGCRVVQGPEPGYPFAYPYYWLDVTDFLNQGPNALAAHVYYQGLVNRVWNSADNRSGFMMALTIQYDDGATDQYATDQTWKCHSLEAFPTGDTTGYKTQFLENIDMRKMPAGWSKPGYDDSAWKAPLMAKPEYTFVRQITPPIQVRKMAPVLSKKTGKNSFFYDFGQEIVGCARIRIKGNAGHVITVHHGEELSAPDTVRWEMRANCKYEERPVLSGNEDIISFYDYKAFRYLEVLDAPAEPEVWADVRHYPFDPERVRFHSANALLENIWRICQNGVQMGSQGGFLDCPSREKGQYLGDAVITARSHLWLTNDPRLTRKCLNDFALSTTIHPGIMAVAPGNFMQEIAEYSLQYPLFVWNYYQFTGDRAGAQQIVDTVFKGLFDYFAAFENSDGLIEGMNEKWVLVDWPKDLRDDYDYDYAADKANTVMNAFYYGALRTAAELMRQIDRDGAPYDARADRVAQGFANRLANPETGLYVDAPGSKHSSLHANAIPLFFGLTQGADKNKILALLAERRLNCGVYIASYVIEACFKQGAADLAYSMLTSQDKHSWAEMIRNGASTCMEAWGPDQKSNTSWCHPWSSSPIYLLTEYVLGLRPGSLGWEEIRISPSPIKNLPEMHLTIPHPLGLVSASYVPGVGYSVYAPLNASVKNEAPQGIPVMIHNEISHSIPEPLSDSDRSLLKNQGWADRVGSGYGVWVSVDRQMLYLLKGMEPVWQARCATAAAGTGSKEGSLKTPLGWHRVSEKIGENAPWGQIFDSLKPTKVWHPGDITSEDLVLTRVLVLEGVEPGKNKGRSPEGESIDSRERCIYIHGTNAEEKIGTPSSHGCIRLLNEDVLAAFDRIQTGTYLLISEQLP